MTQLTEDEIAILVSARTLLSDIHHWCTGGPSCDEFGNRVKPTDPRARWWCAMGAIAKYSPGGLIPYAIITHVDRSFKLFEPAFSQEWGFEQIHDELFDHPRLLTWFDFLLERARPVPIPAPQRFPEP